MPAGRVEIDPPPELPDTDSAGVLGHAVSMLGGLGSVAMVALMSGSATGGRGRSLLVAGILLVTTVGFLLVQLDRQRGRRRQRVDGSRARYLAHLAVVRAKVREAAGQQRLALLRDHPAPAALPALAEERSRLRELPATDPEFLRVRYGVGARPLALELVTPEQAGPDRVDPVAATALARLLAVHRVQRGLPVVVDLRGCRRIELVGPSAAARSLALAMICSAAASHSPRDLTVAVLAQPETLGAWDWVKWLPHARSTRCSDALGPRRTVATDADELRGLLSSGPHLLLVVDGTTEQQPIAPGGADAVTVVRVGGEHRAADHPDALRLEIEGPVGPHSAGPTILVSRGSADAARVVGDSCALATAEALARRLTASPGAVPSRAGPGRRPDPMALLGLHDGHRYDVGTGWRPRRGRELLRVPIGVDDDGRPVHLDLKESAQHGMGPHGLVVGATGSGKSELLRTLVLGLAATHSPEQLALVLVDFKGGATFAGMSAMPHVSAMITNLEQELVLVERMRDALSGELVRRQELLRDAGGYASLRDYDRARAAGVPLAPLPSLLVVVDEFSELLEAKPEFADLFAAIGRLGRSLGLHLLLASQRLEEGRLRGLESHLSYRVGLRTFSAQESRAVLGVPDAYELPARPGVGLLRSGPSSILRFHAGYVSGPAPDPTPPPTSRQTAPATSDLLPWTIATVDSSPSAPEREAGPGQGSGRASLLDVVVTAMAGVPPATHRIWLPPLDRSETLGALVGGLATDPELGLGSRRWRAGGVLTVPIGVVDRPREQRRDPLTVSLTGAGGHVAVVGGPLSGKSTLLRTLVSGLALMTTPRESQVFVLDLGGGTFAGLHGLPHLCGVGTRAEPDVVGRVVAEATAIVDRREGARHSPDDGYGEVFLVVDGWGALRNDFEDVERDLHQLASRGLAFGFHLLTSASRWADYRAGMRDLFGTRLELRLGDPMDSELDRGRAASVPAGRPGRGIDPSGHHFLTALPRIDDDRDPATLAVGVASLVRQVAAAWPGPPAPPLRLLPDLLPEAELRSGLAASAALPGRLLMAVEERELAPTGLDPDVEPHWIVFGDGGSGKTAALRGYLHEVIRSRSPEQAQLVVVDYRRSLLDEVPDRHLLHYLTSAAQAGPVLDELASYLECRLPGDAVSSDQLRSRSWWSGAEVFVVVDDYDLVATSQGSPLQVLQPLLAQARDVGLHLAVARRSGGASRALYEPVLQTLRDLATPGLVLSGSPDEGPLLGGVRPAPARPGRGRLVTRDRGVEAVQVAWREPVG
ncbi:MAG TPA: type VII secretion protein EccCa [Nocardioides sp.]|uniref:type VII secretion protein EccCa n=1 Tax=Nocardioides sp. TaxID=35761 RepID=UPI002E32581C|nr:type VII secretion protein EccCa [Nocardioides sp.]HEX3929651.1 type VII secretion protein EccCa [Nocardioides sp.]